MNRHNLNINLENIIADYSKRFQYLSEVIYNEHYKDSEPLSEISLNQKEIYQKADILAQTILKIVKKYKNSDMLSMRIKEAAVNCCGAYASAEQQKISDSSIINVIKYTANVMFAKSGLIAKGYNSLDKNTKNIIHSALNECIKFYSGLSGTLDLPGRRIKRQSASGTIFKGAYEGARKLSGAIGRGIGSLGAGIANSFNTTKSNPNVKIA